MGFLHKHTLKMRDIHRKALSLRAYIEQNPKLINPIDWKWMSVIIVTLMTLIISTINLFCILSRI